MINGARVKQAREFCGLTQVDLARLMDVHQTSITYIESGRVQPSEAIISRLTIATRFPPAFFRQDNPPDFPEGSLLFRARASISTGVRDRARRYGELLFEMMDRMSKRLKVVSPRLPQLTDAAVDIPLAASFIRNAFGLSPNVPIADLTRTAEKAGIFILSVPFSHPKLDAFSVWAGSDVRRPTVVTFADVPGDRLRWSIAHELAHLALHQAISGTWNAFNREADQLAAELLMPRDGIFDEIEMPVTLSGIAALKPRWGVSLRSLVRRAHELHKLSDRQYRYLNEQIVDRGWAMAEPISIPIERPRAAQRMAELLYNTTARDVDYVRLAADMNLSVMRVREFLDLQATVKPSQRLADACDAHPTNISAFHDKLG